MASKTALSAKNLEALGVQRLAELLIEISTGDASAKRRLRLELVGAQNPRELGREVRKRLTTIARSRSFVEWQGVRSLASDLDTQRRIIVETVAKADPAEGLDLLWRFMALAGPVFARCDDSNGTVSGIFHDACASLADVAMMAKADPIALAGQAFDALVANGYGQFDGLIAILAPALGQQGLAHLKQRMTELSSRPVKRPAEKNRVKIGWSSSGPIYEDEMAEHSRVSTVRMALMDIADAQGDVDAFIGQYDESTRKVPKIAAGIAQRLLAAGRAEAAWTAIEATEHRKSSSWDWPEFDWENARIDVLEALGRPEDAQAARLAVIERSLSATHLRAYLKRLADFDDELPGELVRIADGGHAHFELPFVEHPVRLRLRQPRQLQRERQQRHELLHLQLLAVAGGFGAHGGPSPFVVSCDPPRSRGGSECPRLFYFCVDIHVRIS